MDWLTMPLMGSQEMADDVSLATPWSKTEPCKQYSYFILQNVGRANTAAMNSQLQFGRTSDENKTQFWAASL
jgi:hypothetical protein